jgi:hypothetical protein
MVSVRYEVFNQVYAQASDEVCSNSYYSLYIEVWKKTIAEQSLMNDIRNHLDNEDEIYK